MYISVICITKINTSHFNLCFLYVFISRGGVSQGHYVGWLVARLHIIPRKIPLRAVQHSLTPAILLPAGDIDDVSLLEGQVLGLACVIAVQRHHCASRGTAG